MAAEKAAGSALSKSFSRVLVSTLSDVANRLQAYLDRNEGSTRLRHRLFVPVTKLFWLPLRYFADPIEDLQLELESELGFDWLTADDFDGEVDAEACWQRPFTFAEVEAGYAVDRERPGRDGEECENVTKELFGQLQDGGQRVVLGRPGSGKTTICKSVAVRWYGSDDTGPVLYRKSGQGVLREETDLFHRAIERAKARGPVLVVLEDVARPETVGFLETVKKYAGDSDVSFLLDSRVSEWRSGGETFREEVDVGLQDAVGKSVQSLVGGEIEQRRVPPLDEREVGRVVETFEAKTGKPVQESPEEILERIRSRNVGVEGAVEVDGDSVQAGGDGPMRAEPGPVQSGTGSSARPSPMLLLVYHLQRGDYAVDPEAMDADGSALRTNVEEAYEAVADPVTSDYELMLRGRPELREQIGVLVNVLNAAGLGVRRELVHSLAESRSDHDTIDGFLANMEGILHFGVDEGTRYHAPHPLWSMLYLEVLLERKESEVQAREVFEDAVNALFSFVDDEERREAFREWCGRDVGVLSVMDENPTEAADEIISAVFVIGHERPKLVTLYGTSEYSRLELPVSCSTEMPAWCAQWRSEMYLVTGDVERAVREIGVFREVGVKAGLDSDLVEATFLNTSGNIAFTRGNFDSARECYEQSLEIKREMGSRVGEAVSLNNLGAVALEMEAGEQAKEFYEQSLEIEREVGRRGGEAKALNNLGLVARKQGDYEQARKYNEQSLEISRRLGMRANEAASFDNLGSVALEAGDYNRARDYYETSLEIAQKVGDCARVASCLGNLGVVARSQGDFGQAQKYFERAADIFRTVGATPRRLRACDNLVRTAIGLDNPEYAIDYAKKAISIIEDSDVSALEDERRTFESYLDQLDATDGE